MTTHEKTTDVTVVSTGSADSKPAVKDASDSKIDFKVKKVKIEKLDVKGSNTYRGFTKIGGKICTVKVKKGWETFSPNCEVLASEIIELTEASEAQLKRYDNDKKKVRIDMELLMAA